MITAVYFQIITKEILHNPIKDKQLGDAVINAIVIFLNVKRTGL